MKTNDFKSIIIEPEYFFPELSGFINHISINETLLINDKRTVLPSLPDGMCELIICLGGTYYRSIEKNASKFELISHSHLVGFKTHSSYLIPTLGAKAISIRFQPGCVSAFLKNDFHYFTNQTVDAQVLFGKEFTFLEERLFESTSVQEQLSLIQQFLVSRLSVNENFTRFIHSVRNEYQQKKRFPVKNKAEYKRQERLFKQYMGATPKKFQQLVNFNYATKLISSTSNLNLTQIAHDCNYYDQSHFIKKFKEFSGLTPTEYANLNSEHIRFEQQIINRLF